MSGDKIVTQGHSARFGGLQGHSIGALYPMHVQGWGDDTWQAMNVLTGKYHGKRTTLDKAHALAERLRKRMH